MRSDCSFTKTLLLHTRFIHLFNYFEQCLWQAKGKHLEQNVLVCPQEKQQQARSCVCGEIFALTQTT